MRNLLSELKRRNVHRIAAAYALSAWILIEAGSVLLPTFGGSERLFQGYVVLVIAGFVVAVVLAWIFEWTPEGVKVDRPQDRPAPETPRTRHRLNYAIIALLAIALTVSITLNLTETPPGVPAATAPRSIAVLPFESRGGEAGDTLFADGIHDDLLTRLANIKSLKVISRTSVMEYRGTTLNVRQIGEALGVETVLEGSVRTIGDNVRVNLQLIDATTDEHLWAQTYDRQLTLENIFAIQSEISEAVAAALETRLSPDERLRVTAVPTQDLRAYRLYKEGRQNLYQRQLESLRNARRQFTEAVTLDPGYAEAHAALAESVLLLWNNHRAIAVDEAFAATEASLDRALELDPNLADAYAILGLLKQMQWQEDRTGDGNVASEAAFRRALELNPNHASAWMWFASLRNDEERLDEAIELYQRAMELDPLARVPYANLPLIYAKRGQDRAAMSLWLEALRIHGDWPVVHQYITAHLWGLGRLDEAYAWYVKTMELTDDPLAGGNTNIGILADLGEYDRAIAALDAFPETHLLAPSVPGFRLLLAGEYRQAQKHFVRLIQERAMPPNLLYDLASDSALLAGDFGTARRYALAADPLLAGDAAAAVDRQTARNAVKLAYIHLREGRTQDGTRLLHQALDAIRGLPRLGSFGFGIRDVQIYALLGRREDALNAFREAVDAGFRGSVLFDGWPLEVDPYLDSIRDEPRFRAMVAELDAHVEVMRDRLFEAEATGDFESLRMRAETI